MKGKIKFLAASAILAGNIVLLPGCHQVIDEGAHEEKLSVLDELNNLDEDNYLTQKRIEKVYAAIDDDSVKVKQVLGQSDSNNYTFYTTGGDVMVIVEGENPFVWFSSNITPSDAYSAIASYNDDRVVFCKGAFQYLNPSSFSYLTDSDFISYSDGGKLEVNIGDKVKKITLCEVTESKVKGLNEKQTEEYVLKQIYNYDLPEYALRTLKNSEEVPSVFMKNSDTLAVIYDDNYFETYVGFAEKDFSSIPFFGFIFNEFVKSENVLHKA